MINECKQITLDPVSTDGYSDRDMNQYYSNTFLVHKSDTGTQVVHVLEIQRDNAVCKTYENNNVAVPVTELYRFTPVQGFFYEGNSITEYRYVFSKSYKKGLNSEFVRFLKPDGSSVHNLNNRKILFLLEKLITAVPERPWSPSDDVILSERICTYGGKIHIAQVTKTIGDYKEGVVSTPFESVIQRVQNITGGLECRLTQFPDS